MQTDTCTCDKIAAKKTSKIVETVVPDFRSCSLQERTFVRCCSSRHVCSVLYIGVPAASWWKSAPDSLRLFLRCRGCSSPPPCMGSICLVFISLIPSASDLPFDRAALSSRFPLCAAFVWPRQALRESQRLLQKDRQERQESEAKIAREEALMSEELTRIVEETEASLFFFFLLFRFSLFLPALVVAPGGVAGATSCFRLSFKNEADVCTRSRQSFRGTVRTMTSRAHPREMLEVVVVDEISHAQLFTWSDGYSTTIAALSD